MRVSKTQLNIIWFALILCLFISKGYSQINPCSNEVKKEQIDLLTDSKDVVNKIKLKLSINNKRFAKDKTLNAIVIIENFSKEDLGLHLPSMRPSSFVLIDIKDKELGEKSERLFYSFVPNIGDCIRMIPEDDWNRRLHTNAGIPPEWVDKKLVLKKGEKKELKFDLSKITWALTNIKPQLSPESRKRGALLDVVPKGKYKFYFSLTMGKSSNWSSAGISKLYSNDIEVVIK